MDAKVSETLQKNISSLEAISDEDHPLFPDARAALAGHSIATLLLAVRKSLPEEIQGQTEYALHLYFTIFIQVLQDESSAVKAFHRFLKKTVKGDMDMCVDG